MRQPWKSAPVLLFGAFLLVSCGGSEGGNDQPSDRLVTNLSRIVDETCGGEVVHVEEGIGDFGEHLNEEFFIQCGGRGEEPLRLTSMGFTRLSSNESAEWAVSSFALGRSDISFIDFGPSTALLWQETRGDVSAAYQHRYFRGRIACWLVQGGATDEVTNGSPLSPAFHPRDLAQLALEQSAEDFRMRCTDRR